MKQLTIAVLIISFSFFTTIHADTLMAEDQTPVYAGLLEQYVTDGKVDYSGFKKNEVQLDIYLEYLAATDPSQMLREEHFAFYINAYNAYTIKLILNNFEDGYPPDSIKDIGSFFSKPWSIKFVIIAGKTLTLDNIEHDILRPTFKDARVHFAVNCASKSCPSLIPVPYSGAILDQQLNSNTVAFINNKEENRLEGSTLYISSIFKWFKEDFQSDPIGFFEKYAEGNLKKELISQKGQIKVKYLDYDWSLNDKQ
jgi:hypothetical protein